jgi:hypothetical protein
MRSIGSAVWALAWVVLLAGPAGAQQPAPAVGSPPAAEFGVRAPVPSPTPKLGLEPTRPPEEQGAREQEFYPGDQVRSRHEPAFVTPFVTSVPTSGGSTARVGLSGWTAPRLPFDFRESTGGVAFGLTITWGAPAAQAKALEPEAAGQR